jgi:hypothetical protein
VIAVAGELLAQQRLALRRHFASSIWQVVREQEVRIGGRTVQRTLAKDHLKSWCYRSWIHPRDPHF